MSIAGALRRVGSHIKTGWQIAGVTLLMLVAVNLLASLLMSVHQSLVGGEQFSSDYRPPWFPQYVREASRLRVVWQPYVYWRAARFAGRYINVGENGLRRSWQADRKTDRSFRVFVFGGSTTWGIGARDSFTIPSALAKVLASRGYANAQVINFGQVGYVNTQEILTLLWELRKGNVPDLVIFYDGWNDAESAYQNGTAGIAQNELNRVAEFNSFNANGGADVPHLLPMLFSRLAIVRLTTSLGRRLTNASPFAANNLSFDPYQWISWHFKGKRDEALANEAVDTYLTNLNLVRRVGKVLGFDCLFYWQPLIYFKKPLSSSEQKEFEAMTSNDSGEADFVRMVYTRMRSVIVKQPLAAPIDLTEAFDHFSGTCFIDEGHTTEECNALIASRMGDDVKVSAESNHGR